MVAATAAGGPAARAPGTAAPGAVVDGPAIRIARPGSGGERPAFEDAVEHLGGGREGAGAVRDDLHRAADALEHAHIGVGRSFDLDAVGPHDAPAGEPPAVGERERRSACHDGLEGFLAGHGGAAVEAEARARGADLLGVEHAADESFAIVGGKPAHPHVLERQPVPDGEQQAGGEPEARFVVRGELGDLVLPERAPLRLVGPAPVGGVELGPGHRLACSGADQPHAFLYPAIVEHARRRRQQDGGALRAGVDGEPGLAVGAGLSSADIEGGIGGQRHEAVAAADLDEIGGGPGAGMLIERLAAEEAERIGAHGLDADLEAAGLDGLLDVLGDAGFELGEELVLLGDGER